jgi:hypothetical protein
MNTWSPIIDLLSTTILLSIVTSVFTLRFGKAFFQLFGDGEAIDGVNPGEEGGKILHFVGLQVADQVKLHARKKFPVFLSRLLYPILAENPHPPLVGFPYCFPGLQLGNRHDPDVFFPTPDSKGSLMNPIPNQFQVDHSFV